MIALSQIVGSHRRCRRRRYATSAAAAAAGRTKVLGRAPTHLNVHGALTNCATRIAATEERRLHGRSDNCSTLRGRGW